MFFTTETPTTGVHFKFSHFFNREGREGFRKDHQVWIGFFALFVSKCEHKEGKEGKGWHREF